MQLLMGVQHLQKSMQDHLKLHIEHEKALEAAEER